MQTNRHSHIRLTCKQKKNRHINIQKTQYKATYKQRNTHKHVNKQKHKTIFENTT